MPIFVHDVVELGVRLAGCWAVPLVPAGRDVVDARASRIAVQVLTHEHGAVAGVPQPGGYGRAFELELKHPLEPAVWWPVAKNPAVVRVLAAQDSGARRAAQGQADKVVDEARALIAKQA